MSEHTPEEMFNFNRGVLRTARNELRGTQNWIKSGYIRTVISGANGQYSNSIAGSTLVLYYDSDGKLHGDMYSNFDAIMRLGKTMLKDYLIYRAYTR